MAQHTNPTRFFVFMEPEIWKDIPCFEGFYQASSLGRIKCLRKTPNKILKPYSSPQGYVRVMLWMKKDIQFNVHVLISRTFLPNPLNKPVVNHKNRIKTDNRLCNLELVSYKENHSHYIKSITKGDSISEMYFESNLLIRIKKLISLK